MHEPARPIELAVVGHTNTGKTSLLRTLLRDETFGEVSDRPGTTRHVESAQLLTATGRAVLTLHDTPGLEDAMGVLDYCESLASPDERLDGPDRIQRLLDSPQAHERFEQECRVLDNLRSADAALYVVDARDPVLPKHKDELQLLAACGKPILPVLNFTRSPKADPLAWRKALARMSLHVCVDFDTVAPSLDGEAQLLERLSLLIEEHGATLQALLNDLDQQRLQRRQDASRLVAELLIDAAALRLICLPEADDIAKVTMNLRKRTRDREQECVQSLLHRYRFSKASFPHHPLPLEGERWGMDLFNPQTLRVFGIQLGKGLATGAVAGATVDAITGGLSLGTATLIGAAIGGTWQGASHWGKRIVNRMAGFAEITVDDAVLHLLGLRQLALIRALEARGHAAMQPVDPSSLEGKKAAAEKTATESSASDEMAPDSPAATASPSTAGRQQLPAEAFRILVLARSQPSWSGIGNETLTGAAREQHVQELARVLFEMLQSPLGPAGR